MEVLEQWVLGVPLRSLYTKESKIQSIKKNVVNEGVKEKGSKQRSYTTASDAKEKGGKRR
jgi:hypothetical protein